MASNKNVFRSFLEYALPWFTLLILLTYSYAKFFAHTYGFRWDSETGILFHVFDEQPEPTLKVDDRILRIGNVGWKEFKSDLQSTFFQGARPGNVVPIVVERDGQKLTIPWTYPSRFNPSEFREQLISEWWLAYVFWLAGTLTLLFLRPKDNRWLLLVAFNFLTAIWLIAGSGVSAFHIWNSALVLRMAIWMCVPVYLHLHWVFPRPLGKIPPMLIRSVYSIAFILVIAQWFQLLPEDLYYWGFLVAAAGSLVLLSLHAIRQPEARRELRLLLVIVCLAIIPSIVLGILATVQGIPPWLGGAALLSFPLVPFAYLYAAYRRQLGKLEVRVNRLLSIYLFMILLGTIGVPLTVLAELSWPARGNSLIIAIAVSLSTAIAFLWGYPAFQKFFERRLLRISLPPERIQEAYSARITTSTSLPALLQVLDREVLPSLFVRQFVFLKLDNDSPIVLFAKGVTDAQLHDGCDFTALMGQAGKYRPVHLLNDEQPCPWAYLILPLKVGDSVLGFWLFGRRDPDDMYAQAEIPIFQSLANQTAIALSNILQTERLRTMYQINVDRYEEERKRLALDLHDSILNQLAVLQMNLDEPSQKFQEAYEGLTQRLREIVSDLRPPMLNYGLKPAIDELADNLMERSKDTASVTVGLQSDGNRYSPEVELHVFRIVQEACENALRHAQAKSIKISGSLSAQEIILYLQDDGVGFDLGETLDLDTLISRKHFGLAGMIERAAIIGAKVGIESKPEDGTRIKITWNHIPV
jgi:signal transduction histidine kinase